MEKITERLKNNKTVNLIKTAFISFILLFGSIPLSTVAEVNTNPAVTPGNIYNFDAESGLAGWQTDGLWHITTNRYNSPGHSLWYGDETTKTYNTGGANSGNLISPPITLASGSQPVLYFWSWYQTENNKAYDKKVVQISVNDGQWTDLKLITDAKKTWNKETIDLSGYAGNTIRLRFVFDTVDENLNNYEGWYVDDIQVTSGATSPTPDPTPTPTATSALTTTATPTSTTLDTNLIANPGFETGTTTPNNWVYYTNNGNTPVLDSTTAHSGTKSVKISVSGATNAISGEVWSYNIPSTSGTTYTFSAWGKSQGAGGTNSPAVRLAELDKDYKWLRQTNLYFPKGNADWSKQTATATTGADTAYVAIIANIWNGYGTFWVDDVSLSQNSASTPAPTPTITQSPPTPAPAATPNPTPTPVSTGKTYYIAKNGNDNNPGTEAQPWLTITKAANTLVAGETVYVKEGTYNERVTIKNSGSPGKYITFAAYPGQTAIIDGSGIPLIEWTGLVNINSASYIELSGFRVVNAALFGIMGVGSATSNIIIKKNYIANTAASAILFQDASNVLIDGNEITKAQTRANLPGNLIGQETISLLNVNGFEIRYNKLYDNNFESIMIKEGSRNGKVHDNDVQPNESAGVYVAAWAPQDPTMENIEVFNNKIHDGRSSVRGIAIASEIGGAIKNIKIYNNIVYNVPAQGIVIDTYDGQTCYGSNPCKSGTVDSISIINNDVYNNDFGMGWGGGIHIKYSKATNVIVRNNIAWNNNVQQINSQSTTISDHNLVTDPKFVNPSSGDFSLQSTSPAIDSGSSLGAPNFDFNNKSRPQGAGYDIGALEYSP